MGLWDLCSTQMKLFAAWAWASFDWWDTLSAGWSTAEVTRRTYPETCRKLGLIDAPACGTTIIR